MDTTLGREQAIQLVREGQLPISLGTPTPSAMVLEQDGRFRIRELVVDPSLAEHAATSSGRARTPSWMPAHYYSVGKPSGQIYAEAATRAELAAIMATMSWPQDW